MIVTSWSGLKIEFKLSDIAFLQTWDDSHRPAGVWEEIAALLHLKGCDEDSAIGLKADECERVQRLMRE